MQGMFFSWLIGSHTIFGPQSKHTVVFWTTLAKNNVNTDSTVCFVLGLFHWRRLLVCPDTPSQDLKSPFAWRHCRSAPPCCSLALFREQTVAMFILAPFRKVQIAWKATETRFWNVKLLYLNRLLIILCLLEVKKSRSGSLKKWTRGICCYLQTNLATGIWVVKCFKWTLGFIFRHMPAEYDTVHPKLQKSLTCCHLRSKRT